MIKTYKLEPELAKSSYDEESYFKEIDVYIISNEIHNSLIY